MPLGPLAIAGISAGVGFVGNLISANAQKRRSRRLISQLGQYNGTPQIARALGNFDNVTNSQFGNFRRLASAGTPSLSDFAGDSYRTGGTGGFAAKRRQAAQQQGLQFASQQFTNYRLGRENQRSQLLGALAQDNQFAAQNRQNATRLGLQARAQNRQFGAAGNLFRNAQRFGLAQLGARYNERADREYSQRRFGDVIKAIDAAKDTLLPRPVDYSSTSRSGDGKSIYGIGANTQLNPLPPGLQEATGLTNWQQLRSLTEAQGSVALSQTFINLFGNLLNSVVGGINQPQNNRPTFGVQFNN